MGAVIRYVRYRFFLSDQTWKENRLFKHAQSLQLAGDKGHAILPGAFIFKICRSHIVKLIIKGNVVVPLGRHRPYFQTRHSFCINAFFLNKIIFLNNEIVFKLTLKIYNSEHLVSILSHRHQSMKRKSNQHLKRCLEVMFLVNYN